MVHPRRHLNCLSYAILVIHHGVCCAGLRGFFYTERINKMSDNKVLIFCAYTGKEQLTGVTKAGNPRPPRGWKSIGGQYFSPEGWHDRYCIRAVTIPVVSPLVNKKATSDDWEQLRSQLAVAWQRSTEATNWALRRLLVNDIERTAGQKKCPPMPPIYLYGERDWTGWSQSAASVLRATEAKYRSCRYEIIWTGSMQLPSMRYPQPYPVHNTGWKLAEGKDGGLGFGCLLPGGRINVRLRGGHRYRRQLEGLRWLIEHPEMRGEAAIFRRKNEIMIKMVGWFPRKQQKFDGVMYVRTDPQSFLIGLNARDERLWIINGERAQEWTRRYYHGLQRWREDQKYEMRNPKRQQRKTAEDQQSRTRKFRNRINTFVDESAAQVVNHAKRRRLATIKLNDSDHSFFSDFPWHRLVSGISQRCNAEGIQFERSSTEKTTDTSRKSVTN